MKSPRPHLRKHKFQLNDSFGKLTIIKEADYIFYEGRRELGHLCKCDCGNTIFFIISNLVKQNVFKGCFECKKQNRIAKCYKHSFANGLYNHIKNAAKDRNVEFNISIEYLEKIAINQNFKCALSGVDLTFPKINKEITKTNCSLDRIDSSKGYIEGNVQWVHKTVNFMKMNITQSDFIDFCCKIALYTGTLNGNK